MRVTVKALDRGDPNRVYVPEQDRTYEEGESFELAKDRAERMIALGYLEEAKPASSNTKKSEE